MRNVKLSYPVIVLYKKDSMVYVYFKEKELKSTNEDLFRKLDYTAITIIDSLGYKYTIRHAFKIKYLGLWGFNPLLKGRQIFIDFEYNPIVQIVPLNTFKEEVINKILGNKIFWKASWTINELNQRIYNCSNFSEIATLLK